MQLQTLSYKYTTLHSQSLTNTRPLHPVSEHAEGDESPSGDVKAWPGGLFASDCHYTTQENTDRTQQSTEVHRGIWHVRTGSQWGGVELNPLRAKFFRGNINIYLHFISLLHIDVTQVLKILTQVRPGLTYSTQSISWLLMSWRHKEPGHQQPWYWPSQTKITRSLQVKG